MEELNKVEKLAGHIKEYAETKFDLVVLNTQDKFTDILSSVVASAAGMVLGVFVLLFASIGAALWLGDCLNSPFIGFFCVAGFYLLVALLVIVNRKRWIKEPMINSLLKKININEEN